MLHDKYLFEYIYSVAANLKGNIYENIDSKKDSIKNYKSHFDYVGKCNNDIYDILNNTK